LNKPIPAIVRFREKFTIKTKEGLNLDDGKNIYAGSRGLTEDIETFLVAELLNKQERIEIQSYNRGFADGVKAQQDIIEKEYQAELKEGGE
jgi:hypothetical protein